MMTATSKKKNEQANPAPRGTQATKAEVDFEVIIVGAGFGGMGIAIQLQRMGIDRILIVDRAGDLGGTWHVNTYPGLAVDIASVTYSYSFEPNPNWSRMYAPGSELKAYANHIAAKYDLRRRMRFNSSVDHVKYNEATATWTVFLEGQEPLTTRILVLATGYLAQPKRPNIAGLDSFAGKVIHTAEWDHNYELRGTRAAVIGTGATAVQLLPEIAPLVKHLDVYQRTPIWVAPKNDPEIPPRVRAMFARIPFTQRLARYANCTLLELFMVTPALRHREFPRLSKGIERLCRRHMAHQIPDRALRRKLTPSYSFGCKRPTFSNDYFPTFVRPNVELITEGIDHIEPDGIVSKDGRKREIDALILATGYKVWEKGNFPAFAVYGRGGVELGAWWNEHGYESYEGITVHGFPNMFYLASPYSFTGLSYFFAIEGHMKHVARCVGELRRKGKTTFEVQKHAQDAFVAQMRSSVKGTVFANGNCAPANSYYFNQHGESTLLRLTPTPVALWKASRFPLEDYRFH